MKIPVKKTTCAVMAGAILVSMTGCSQIEDMIGKTDKDDPSKEVMETAEDFCDAVADGDIDKILKLSSEDMEDKEDQIKEAMDIDSYSDDMGGILKAITDTIEYEIDEDSLNVDDDKAEIDVTFTVFDYLDNEFDDDVDTLDEAEDAIADGDTKEIAITLEFELTDDGWVISDTEDILDAVYEFYMMGALSPDFSFDDAAYDYDDLDDQDDDNDYYDDYDYDYDYDSDDSDDEYDFGTTYNFEQDIYCMSYMNASGCTEMYEAFTELATWEGTTSNNPQIGIYDSGVDEIRFVQPSDVDLGEVGMSVVYSPISEANVGDTIALDTFYLDPVVDQDGNVSYEIVIEAPADGYYRIEIAPTVADLYTPVVSATCRVGAEA